jgi:hypothetical protein
MKKHCSLLVFLLWLQVSFAAPTYVYTFGALAAAIRSMQATGGNIELAGHITIVPGVHGSYAMTSTGGKIYINTAGYSITVKGTGSAVDSATLVVGNNIVLYGAGTVLRNETQGLIRMAGGEVRMGPLSSKRGVGLSTNNLNINDWAACIVNLKASWFYTWGNTDRSTTISGAEFVPMIWGKANATKTACDNINAAYRAGRVKYVLGFNEPDLVAESNMPVDTALKYWKFLCDNLDAGVKLVSPAPYYPTNVWLKSFMDSCTKRNLRVDHVAVHIYAGIGTSIYETAIREVYNRYGKPVWITEYAPRDDNATSSIPNKFDMQNDVLPFMRTTTSKYEDMPEVFRYAWFTSTSATMYGLSSAMLTSPSLTLNMLGEYYKTIYPNNSAGIP